MLKSFTVFIHISSRQMINIKKLAKPDIIKEVINLIHAPITITAIKYNNIL